MPPPHPPSLQFHHLARLTLRLTRHRCFNGKDKDNRHDIPTGEPPMDTETTTEERTPLAYDEHGVARTPWAVTSSLLTNYYDTEWGLPIRDEAGLFERLSLESFQSGLSWAVVLKSARPSARPFAILIRTRLRNSVRPRWSTCLPMPPLSATSPRSAPPSITRRPPLNCAKMAA